MYFCHFKKNIPNFGYHCTDMRSSSRTIQIFNKACTSIIVRTWQTRGSRNSSRNHRKIVIMHYLLIMQFIISQGKKFPKNDRLKLFMCFLSLSISWKLWSSLVSEMPNRSKGYFFVLMEVFITLKSEVRKHQTQRKLCSNLS